MYSNDFSTGDALEFSIVVYRFGDLIYLVLLLCNWLKQANVMGVTGGGAPPVPSTLHLMGLMLACA